ncbi:MAG: hypothetical protein LBV49_04160 [Azonexus sp.]|jgi:hypothetical protein|nr:hypothetical protein [Azonexus sp.]
MLSANRQQGNGALSFLLWAFCLSLSVSFLISYYYLPAEPKDVQEIVSLAATSPEAKAVVVASLKKTPNPKNSELNDLRSRVNEVIVTETARTITGDKTLETPSAREVSRERQETARLASIKSKTWAEMNNGERGEVIVPILIGITGSMFAVMFVIFIIRKIVSL